MIRQHFKEAVEEEESSQEVVLVVRSRREVELEVRLLRLSAAEQNSARSTTTNDHQSTNHQPKVESSLMAGFGTRIERRMTACIELGDTERQALREMHLDAELAEAAVLGECDTGAGLGDELVVDH